MQFHVSFSRAPCCCFTRNCNDVFYCGACFVIVWRIKVTWKRLKWIQDAQWAHPLSKILIIPLFAGTKIKSKVYKNTFASFCFFCHASFCLFFVFFLNVLWLFVIFQNFFLNYFFMPFWSSLVSITIIVSL